MTAANSFTLPPCSLNMAPANRVSTLMVELPPDTPLWAVANEARHWSAAEVAPLKVNPSALASLLRVPKGRQRRLLSDEGAPSQVPNRALLDSKDLEARLSEAARELLGMVLSGIQPMPLFSGSYPHRLSTIADPPLLLYVLGTLQSFDRCVAVSGTRAPSQWGMRTAERLARRLAETPWIVTSGLAKGIDTRAHRGALSAANGRTVAVSALPLNRIYPAENLDLARQISERGALVSEHGLAQGAGKVEFLRRNRIISGLSFAHFIVETSGEGGTWAQATTAKAQGRPLFAIRPPRSESKAYRGYEALLEMGAVTCGSVEEALRQVADLWAEERA
jgi:DNA processing protein